MRVSLPACVQWDIKKFLKTWFPRVGVVGGLAVYLAGLVVYSCKARLKGLGFSRSFWAWEKKKN